MIFCVEMSKYILLAREMNRFWSGSISSIRNNSHKKRKDVLETRVQRAVLCAYVENQAILKLTLLYHASAYKQTKRLGRCKHVSIKICQRNC